MYDSAFKSRVYLLAYLGLVPLCLSTLMLILMSMLNISNELALTMTHYYGAIVLTFIGAIHWGRAMQNSNVQSVTLSVLPSIYAFICLLIPVTLALPILIFGFLALYFYDADQYSQYPWFKAMRARLTVLFSGLLLINWLVTGAYA